MRMRFLGKTGLQVSEICLGTGSFGGRGGYENTGAIGQKDANYVISLALNSGINFFNTAETYSGGWAEEILGEALGARRKEAIIITKVHPTRSPGPNDGGFSRKHLIEGCDASLKRLQTDYIDIYELHMFDEHTPLEVTLRALDDLVRAGKVRYIGCSNFSGWQVMKCLAISRENRWSSFSTLEIQYNLACRWPEFEQVPVCLDQGVAILCFSPLHGGFLSGKYHRNKPWPAGTRFKSLENTEPWPVEPDKLFEIVDELDKVAKAHNATVSQAALNYQLKKPGVSSLIIGIRVAEQLKENLKTVEWEINPEEVARLDKVSEPLRRYPYFVFNPVKKGPDSTEH
jgi:aryl-alcohol dehydrogenase-like predicted oxidoreductase